MDLSTLIRMDLSKIVTINQSNPVLMDLSKLGSVDISNLVPMYIITLAT